MYVNSSKRNLSWKHRPLHLLLNMSYNECLWSREGNGIPDELFKGIFLFSYYYIYCDREIPLGICKNIFFT